MYSSKIKENLIYKIIDADNSNYINNNDELFRLNYNIQEKLNIQKNKIDVIYNENPKTWDKVKKFTNEYEFIYTNHSNLYKNISNIYPISRSYFKLWEILHDFNLINIENNEQKYITCHLAEGPGGFIECIYKYINKYITDNFNNILIYGNTLINTNSTIPKWKIRKDMINKYNIRLNNKKFSNGDLYNIEEIEKLIRLIGENKCELITADGGFDFSNDYNSQEKLFLRLFVSEIYLILNLLKKNGNAIIKIYDIFSELSIKLIYIIKMFFEDIYIIKPYTSRPANSEKYILCKNMKIINEKNFYFDIFKEIIIKNDINILNKYNILINKDFLQNILNYNIWYSNRQIKYINNTINLIQTINKDNNYDLKPLYNDNKTHCINWCKNYDIL